MQQQEFDKATEYLREMKRMAEISDINHIYKNDYNSDNCVNNKRSTYNRNQGIKSIFASDSSSNKSNDFSLILALILLLSKDGGDKLLIFALLYIMT